MFNCADHPLRIDNSIRETTYAQTSPENSWQAAQTVSQTAHQRHQRINHSVLIIVCSSAHLTHE